MSHTLTPHRTGYAKAEFAPPYHLAWTHQFRHKPRPAWKEPAWELQRISRWPDPYRGACVAADAEAVSALSQRIPGGSE